MSLSGSKKQKVFVKGSMYGIFRYMYQKNQPNVGKYTIHRSYGFVKGAIVQN